MNVLAAGNPLDHVVPHEVFTIGDIPINNHLIMGVVSGVLMLLVFPALFGKSQLVPSGIRNFFEAICVYFREEVARPMLHDETDRFMPYIWTTFFFILFSNLLGMIPIDGIVYIVTGGAVQAHIGGTSTGNIFVTGALATIAFFTVHISGIAAKIRHEREHGGGGGSAIKGFVGYWVGMVPHLGGMPMAVVIPLGVFIFFLEFLGVLVKSVALAIRLFANMMAGHILLAVLAMFVVMAPPTSLIGVIVSTSSIVGSVAISCLELFVAFLQAYIFTFLATIFISMSVHQDH